MADIDAKAKELAGRLNNRALARLSLKQPKSLDKADASLDMDSAALILSQAETITELNAALSINNLGADTYSATLAAKKKAVELAQEYKHRAEATEAEVARLTKALEETRRRARNIWGAISSNQVDDKDALGQAKRLMDFIDEARAAKEGQDG